MKIDHINYQESKHQLWLHDTKVTGMTVDILSKKISLRLYKNYCNPPKQFEYIFYDTIYLQMTNYSPWMDSDEINGIYFDDMNDLETQYHPLWENVKKGDQMNLQETLLADKLLVGIDFISGNVIRIVCASLEVNETVLD